MPRSTGFTLIEFLIVLGVLAVAVGSALVILTSVLRGTNQANITSEVKQNGQAVLDSLDSQIRNGRDAVALAPPSGASSAVKVTLADSRYLYIACFNTIGNTANGYIGTFSSAVDSAPSPLSYVALTNRDIISGVDVTCNDPNCQPANVAFSAINASTVNPAIVKLCFVVNQGVGAPSRQDFKANVKFETRISLRKY